MSNTKKAPIFAIVGPTAAGKTNIAFKAAIEIGAEVISVDSRQVYRFLDIGTDKISHERRIEVPHHLIDVADPDEPFTAADFVRMADAAADRITARGRIPILAGGTAMYFKALEGRMLSESLPRDVSIRRSLEERASSGELASMHEELREADPTSASKIHPNDKLRVVRALELLTLTGEPPSMIFERAAKMGGSREIIYFGIDAPREELYKKIAARAASQFENGYADEVARLLDRGYSRDLPAMQGFGYRELVRYHDGEISLQDALDGDIRSTKAFARRQMTWFRQFSPIKWYDGSVISVDDIVRDMINIIMRDR